MNRQILQLEVTKVCLFSYLNLKWNQIGVSRELVQKHEQRLTK